MPQHLSLIFVSCGGFFQGTEGAHSIENEALKGHISLTYEHYSNSFEFTSLLFRNFKNFIHILF